VLQQSLVDSGLELDQHLKVEFIGFNQLAHLVQKALGSSRVVELTELETCLDDCSLGSLTFFLKQIFSQLSQVLQRTKSSYLVV
jgi:hypothetical protein